jgi:hypothetical protein
VAFPPYQHNLGFQILVYDNDMCELKQMVALMQERFYIVNHYYTRGLAVTFYMLAEEPSNKKAPLQKMLSVTFSR